MATLLVAIAALMYVPRAAGTALAGCPARHTRRRRQLSYGPLIQNGIA